MYTFWSDLCDDMNYTIFIYDTVWVHLTDCCILLKYFRLLLTTLSSFSVSCLFFLHSCSPPVVRSLLFVCIIISWFWYYCALCIVNNVTTCNMICSQFTNNKAFDKNNHIYAICYIQSPVFSVQHSVHKSECKIRTNTLLKSLKLEFRNEKFICGKNGLNVQNEIPDANVWYSGLCMGISMFFCNQQSEKKT